MTTIDLRPTAAPTTHETGTDELDGHRLEWPAALCITVLIALWAMVCAGWFDPMLPWVK
jgi:hypothetical protein